MSSTAPHQAIYRRWRAQTFSQIVGQEAVVATLRNAVRSGRVSHAILFVGPRGTGKTSLARILAKAINCTDLRDGDPCDACPSCVAIREGTTLDVVEIDAASNRGINEVRELRDRLQYAPTALRRKVYILDEAHQITKDAWNALLKSLEEPPDFVVFMFASTHPHDFPPAILSRLQRYDVRRLSLAEIEGKLIRIMAADGRTAEPSAVDLIARLAAGGMRDAESMLDQLLSSVDGRLDERSVRDLLGLAEMEAVERFTAALAGRAPAAGIAILDELEERGRDLRIFLDQVVERLRAGFVASLTEPGRAPGSRPDLVAAARRLALIDPGRAGIGGLRLQLEIALFGEGALDAGASFATPPPSGRAAAPQPVQPEPLHPPAASAGASSQPPTHPAAGPEPAAQALEPAGGPAPHTSLESRATAVPAAKHEPRVSAASAAATAANPDTSRTGFPPADRSRPAGNAPDPTDEGPPEPGGHGEAPEPGGHGEAPELSQLRELWPQIVAHISAHPPTRPLIVACRPIAVDGNVVTLGFPEDQAFLKDVAVRRRPNLESGIAQFLGHAVSVRCVATNLDAVSLGGGDAEAGFLLAEARRIFADDLVDLGEIL